MKQFAKLIERVWLVYLNTNKKRLEFILNITKMANDMGSKAKPGVY